MNNKTTVRLTVRSEDFVKHKDVFYGYHDTHEYDGFVTLTYLDVLYGCLTFELSIQESNIPYDKYWDNGKAFLHGSEYCRILPSGCIHVWENISINDLMVDKIISETKKNGISDLNGHKEKQVPIMGWHAQEQILKKINGST